MGEGHLYDGLFGGQQMSQVDFKTEIGGVAHGSRWLIGPQSPLLGEMKFHQVKMKALKGATTWWNFNRKFEPEVE